MNYGEELAYWYCRLNGFFLLQNFVIHRKGNERYPTDCDLLGVRMPFVFEEIGGRPEDWDSFLFDKFDITKILGIYVEVKTGAYNNDHLFNRQYLKYAVERMGTINDVEAEIDTIDNNPITLLENRTQIGKILIAQNAPRRPYDKFVYISISHVIEFITARINRYPSEKFRDRIFFNSDLLQLLIHQVNSEMRNQNVEERTLFT